MQPSEHADRREAGNRASKPSDPTSVHVIQNVQSSTGGITPDGRLWSSY
jgi:hypothetical protein